MWTDVFELVKLKFYGGVNEIGGNKILLSDEKVEVFFDFGEPFNLGVDYYTGWLRPRSVKGLGDYFEYGLLPKKKGLYAQEHLTFTDLIYSKPKVDAVFLSHAHFDHINHIKFLDPKIPVYLGAGTKLFLEAMEKTSSFCNYGKHNYQTFRTGDKIKVGNLVVEPVHVDHSIPAAYGFIVHTSKGAVVYTGDLRLHGPRKDLTEDFLARAAGCKPAALISEGTRVVERENRKNFSESQVEELSNNIVSDTDKIVFFARYSRDMDRFRTFYNVAKKNNRRIVTTPKTAYLLSKLVDDKRLDLPNPWNDQKVLVYYKRKKSGQFEGKDYYLWEREFFEKKPSRAVTCEFVHENQNNLIMDLDFYQFTELIDIKPNPESHFIHSMSEPFSEEDIEDHIMHNWLRHFGIRFHQLHASGHMNKKQLFDMIRFINPKRIFPIHTENPQAFKKTNDNVQMIKNGRSYMLH